MRPNFPIREDYNDALDSVLLILDVYLIEPKDFAKGLLNDKQYNSSLNALDLYALGQYAFKNKYYKDAHNWLYLTCVYFMNAEEAQINYYKVLGLHEMDLSQIYAMNLLKITPFKCEILNDLPFVAIYHDIISDREIEELKRIAVPTIKRSTVYDYAKETNVPVNYRTSNSVFLNNNDSYVVDILRQRVSDMTHLNVFANSSDQLQVMNYGLGGYFRSHFDFFGKDMTNVQQGGATVFPPLRITNFPKKGSALIFSNLDNNISPDPSTLHAGCPVLFGSKWAATKWIYSSEQMFRKPCLPPNQLKAYDTQVIDFVHQILGL
ncbi:prolyl 4-hydroxylase subunit alpha-1-like [Drosophila tropicalis]|uniref:prolyl 4-hydroxylase subunit alpha-1-like n=1 Tax=Drosophila tropicalis TaxID=46794 RepID=UPI0035ABF126